MRARAIQVFGGLCHARLAFGDLEQPRSGETEQPAGARIAGNRGEGALGKTDGCRRVAGRPRGLGVVPELVGCLPRHLQETLAFDLGPHARELLRHRGRAGMLDQQRLERRDRIGFAARLEGVAGLSQALGDDAEAILRDFVRRSRRRDLRGDLGQRP